MASPRVDQILATLMSGNRGNSTLPELLCSACLDSLPVTGAGIALMSQADHQGVVAATDGVARQMEDLQFTLGEGPCMDASRDGRPVLQAQFEKTGPKRWPLFAPAVLEAGVAAVFALPLQIGAIGLGVLDLYRDTAGALSDDQLSDALAYADAATLLLLHLQDQVEPGHGLHPQLSDPLGWQPEIHQSTGMIAFQAAVTLAEALLILRARAFSDERPIGEVAHDVVARRLKFHPGGSAQE